jgi:hypothetical protein
MITRHFGIVVTAAALMLAVVPLIVQATVATDGEPVLVREGDRKLLLAAGPDGQSVLVSSPATGGATQVDVLALSGASVEAWDVPGGADVEVLDGLWTEAGRIVLLRCEPGAGLSDRRLVLEQYEPDGTPAAETIVVSDHAERAGTLAEDATGRLLVAWLEIDRDDPLTDPEQLLLARFDPDGSQLLGPILVSSEDRIGGSWIYQPRIAPGPGGRVAVLAGHGDCGMLGCGTAILGTWLAADGTKLPGGLHIGTSARALAAAAVSSGEVAVVWTRPSPAMPGFDHDAGPFVVYAQRFTPGSHGPEWEVTPSPGSWAPLSEMTPELAADGRDAALVIWEDLGSAGASAGQILVRSLDRDGAPSGSTLALATGARPVARAVAREHFLAAWSGELDGVAGVIVQPLRWIADPCTGQATTLCLGNGRFEITAEWAAPDGQGGSGAAVPLTSDSGYFWFFSQGNVELVVKVLDACAERSNRFWVFAAGLTDLEVRLSVRDRVGGVEQEYVNPLGQPFEPITDTTTFETCPPNT